MKKLTITTSSKTQPPSVSSLHSVALQDHYAKLLGLPGIGKSSIRNSNRRVVPSRNGNQPKEIERVLGPPVSPLTLAQKCGIVPAPKERLSEAQWGEVKKRAIHRSKDELACAICQEAAFHLREQVLLSCSHTFHRTCLNSYEKYIGKKCCPMCREASYEKRLVFIGSRQQRLESAIKIQAWWRGRKARLHYLEYRSKTMPKHPILKKKYLADKLSETVNHMYAVVEQDSLDIDRVFEDMNQTLLRTRLIFQGDVNDVTPPDLPMICQPLVETDWDKVYEEAVQREFRDCPICIMPLLSKHKYETDLVLLSCTHLYHKTCLDNFEKFDTNLYLHKCPCCRQTYNRLVLPRQNT